MRKVCLIAVSLALLIGIPAAMAQSSACIAVTPSNSAFNATLLGSGISGASGSPNGFVNVNLSLSGNQATVTASSLGLSNITGISLYQGQPGTSNAVLVQTFSNSSNNFTNGQFSGTMTLSSTLISQIQANPSNYFFVVTTPDFPNGAVAGALVPTRQQLITGVLPAQSSTSGNGAFLLSIGPSNGTDTVTLNYDIFLNGLGNGTISSLQLLQAGGITPLLTLNNVTVVNNRIVGSTQIPASLAQQILASPCSFSLGLNGAVFTNGSLIAPLSASNEVFLPVVGSAQGANGTNFQTDISIFNNSAQGLTTASANTFVQFFPTGTTNSSTSVTAQSVTALSIPPRGTTTLRDVTTSLFNGSISGIGAMRILSGSSVFANARIYNNQIASGRGTFGQFEPGMTRSQALQQGVLVGVGNVTANASLANGQSFRTNIGFFNPNDTSTTVAAEIRDTNGAVIGTQRITLGPWMHEQIPLTGTSGLFNNINGDTGTSSVFFLSGNPIFAYASIIDNVSGDASFVTPSAQ
jgi:hypothetical protein